MAALAALIAFGLLTVAPQARPLLVEVARHEIDRTVRAVTVGANGTQYLTDPEQHRISLRQPDGTAGGSVGGYGWGLSALDDPSGTATDGNRVYVADRGNHRIVSYDRALRPLGMFATRDTNDPRARFGYPKGVAVSGRGDLVVLDGESQEVVGFRPDRRVAFRVGREVAGGAPLIDPSCIHVDDRERLLVGESGGIRMLDLFGNQVASIPLGEQTALRAVAGSGDWIAAVSADTLYLVHTADASVQRWSRSAIAADTPVHELWSVAWSGRDLLILATGSMVRFRIEE